MEFKFATMGYCYKTFFRGNLLPFYFNYHGNIVFITQNDRGMAVNYYGKRFYNIGPW